MTVGRYMLSVHNHGFFRLDGGAMFGAVPKNLWSRVAPPDDQNRILMAARSLVIDDGSRRFLVDVGCGDKWDKKSRLIFEFDPGPYQPVPGITDVILTHLHFDHAGGVSRFGADRALELCYPDARHHVPEVNRANALEPNVRERASYLAENVDVLDGSDLHLTHDGDEIAPGITVHCSNGHTRGLHWVKVSDGDDTVAFPADLMPTSHHIPLAYHMGYDMCAETVIAEKGVFLDQAVDEGWTVVFEHDPEVAAVRIGRNPQGRFEAIERVEL